MSTAVVYSPMNLLEFAMQNLGFRNSNQVTKLQPTSKEWKILKAVLKGVRVTVTTPSAQSHKPSRPIKNLVENVGGYEFNFKGEPMTVGVCPFLCRITISLQLK